MSAEQTVYDRLVDIEDELGYIIADLPVGTTEAHAAAHIAAAKIAVSEALDILEPA